MDTMLFLLIYDQFLSFFVLFWVYHISFGVGILKLFASIGIWDKVAFYLLILTASPFWEILSWFPLSSSEYICMKMRDIKFYINIFSWALFFIIFFLWDPIFVISTMAPHILPIALDRSCVCSLLPHISHVLSMKSFTIWVLWTVLHGQVF